MGVTVLMKNQKESDFREKKSKIIDIHKLERHEAMQQKKE